MQPDQSQIHNQSSSSLQSQVNRLFVILHAQFYMLTVHCIGRIPSRYRAQTQTREKKAIVRMNRVMTFSSNPGHRIH